MGLATLTRGWIFAAYPHRGVYAWWAQADVIGGLAHILGAPLSPAHTPLPLQGYAGDEQLVASLQAGLGGDLGSFVHAADRFTTMREALQ